VTASIQSGVNYCQQVYFSYKHYFNFLVVVIVTEILLAWSPDVLRDADIHRSSDAVLKPSFWPKIRLMLADSNSWC